MLLCDCKWWTVDRISKCLSVDACVCVCVYGGVSDRDGPSEGRMEIKTVESNRKRGDGWMKGGKKCCGERREEGKSVS